MTAAMKIEYRPIGIVHSPFNNIEGVPIQPSRAKGVLGSVEVHPQFVEGLADLDGFSHIILLCHFHQSQGYRLKVVPFLDTELRGLFATRAPKRPNPIGLSVVKLLGIEENFISIECVDLLEGTPVLDIKPYVLEFDRREKVRVGWLETVGNQSAVSDDRFR